jgi:hypothetical protein
MNARCSPSRILSNHPEDQLSKLSRRRPSPDGFADFGNQFPVQPEAGSVPPDHCFRRDDDERSFPSRPEPTGRNPEELVKDA